MKKKWVAGWNMPGYLPEMEPVEFDSRNEATEFLVNELVSEGASESEARRELAEYGETQYKEYVYWVTQG